MIMCDDEHGQLMRSDKSLLKTVSVSLTCMRQS
jgi:hypothetical protein